ncbi:ENTK Enteropeptidase, partial [Amia calva]|nr:ENTK Enteropeptidase [Amia calva]
MPVVSRLWVVAGQRVLSASEDSSQRRGVRRLVLNKGYNKVTHDNDLALLQLTEPLSFSLYVQPVCLLTREEEEAGLELCFISGWGTTTYKGMAVDVLQEAEVQLIPMETCNQWDWYGGILTQHMQCAGNEAGGIDTCQGDSGGPLQCYNEDLDRFYLVGVTSFGEGCASVNRPGVYARVSRYYSWVQYTQDQVRSGVASIQPWLLLTGLTLCTMVQL